MLDRLDDDTIKRIKKLQEILPGGDIRTKGNLWVRAAFRDSGLKRVPRENQVREAIYKVVKKKN